MREGSGRILKGVGGFYYVEAGGQVYECRARGIFRKEKTTPAVGDLARISMEEDGTGAVEEILPRKNRLVRPPVANLDQLVVVASVCDPAPNLLVIDKVIAAAEYHGIAPVVAASKTDLESAARLEEIYTKAGIPFVAVSSQTGEGVEALRELLRGKITAFTGNSGVAESSLLNRIDPRLGLETAEISRKLGRGRHTTRHVELFPLEGGGYVADTPGFSSVDLERGTLILKEELPGCFREFAPYLGQCRFPSCSHTCEKGCAVLGAVREGRIAVSRHENYCAMVEEVKEIKEWQRKGIV